MLARTACWSSASGSSRSGVASSADRGTDPADDRPQVARSLIDRLLQHLERGRHRSTLGVAEDDDQPGAESRSGELHAVDLRGGDDIARDADDEQVAESLIEDQLRWDSRIGAAKDNRERLLPGCQRQPPRPVRAGVAVARFRYEPAISLAQPRERFRR
jgi:hypothetical protein